MKLLRYGPKGQEKPGILDAQAEIRDLSGIVSDISGDVLSDESLQKISALDVENLPLVASVNRIGPCVANVGKFICIGRSSSP